VAWRTPPEEWYPCLYPWEKDTIAFVCDLLVPGQYVLTATQYILITGWTDLGYETERDFLFRKVYKVVYSKTTFPFPLDEIFTFNSALWGEIRAYLAGDPETDISDCPQVKFIGARGGAWLPPPT